MVLCCSTEQFEELTGQSTGGWVGPIEVPELMLAINSSIFAIPILKTLSNAADFNGLAAHLSTKLRHAFPWCTSPPKPTRLARRTVLYHEVEGLVITEPKQPSDFEQIMPKEEQGPRSSDSDPDSSRSRSDPALSGSAGAGLLRAVSAGGDGEGMREDAVEVEEVEVEDGFRAGPSAAEYAALTRMAQHLDLLEQEAAAVIEGDGEVQANTEHDLRVLLERIKVDAAVLQEEMPTGVAQDQLQEIAYATIDKLEEALDNLCAEPSVQVEKSEWIERKLSTQEVGYA